MIKLCQLRKQGGQSSFIVRMDQSGQQQATFLRSAAHLPATGNRQLLLGRPGSGALMLPATQQPAPTGALALRARFSPAMSLFNRLDGFVLQLESSRDFFAHWPDQICQRIRSASGNPKSAQASIIMNANQPNAEEEPLQQQQNSSAICWTGQNYGSYTKKLVEFGKTSMQDHPEIPIATPTRVNEKILNFIDKLRQINDQLMQQSNKLPPTSQAQFYNTRTRPVPAIKTGDLRRTVSSPPGAPLSAQARVSSASPELIIGSISSQQAGRQSIDLVSVMAQATSLPQSIQDEANENGPDESDDSSAQFDEEDEEEEIGEDICKDEDCGETNNNGINNSDEQSANKLHQPAFASEDQQQQQQQDYEIPTVRPTSQRQPVRISSSFPGATPPYTTPTITWEYPANDDSQYFRQSSSSASHHHQSTIGNLFPLTILLVVSSVWFLSWSPTRRTASIVQH